MNCKEVYEMRCIDRDAELHHHSAHEEDLRRHHQVPNDGQDDAAVHYVVHAAVVLSHRAIKKRSTVAFDNVFLEQVIERSDGALIDITSSWPSSVFLCVMMMRVCRSRSKPHTPLVQLTVLMMPFSAVLAGVLEHLKRERPRFPVVAVSI